LATGEIVALAPDVIAMDMSTRAECVPPNYAWMCAAFPNVPEARKRAYLATLKVGFMKHVLFGGPYIGELFNSWLSGVPGTTIGNIFNSARMQTTIDLLVSDREKDVKMSEVPAMVKACFAKIKATYGYEFKGFQTPSSFTHSSLFGPNSPGVITSLEVIKKNGLPLPFLGNCLTIIDGLPIMVTPEPSKFGASLVLPGHYNKPTDFTADRILGVYLSGGWTDQKLSAMLGPAYEDARSTVSTTGPLSVGISEDEMPSEDAKLVKAVFEKAQLFQKLPSKSCMVDMYTMDKMAWCLKYGTKVPVLATKEATKAVPNSEAGAAAAVSRPLATFDFSEIDEMAEMAAAAMAKDVRVDSTVSLSKAGKGNAKTKTEDKEKAVALAAKQAAQQAQRLAGRDENKEFKDKHSKLLTGSSDWADENDQPDGTAEEQDLRDADEDYGDEAPEDDELDREFERNQRRLERDAEVSDMPKGMENSEGFGDVEHMAGADDFLF